MIMDSLTEAFLKIREGKVPEPSESPFPFLDELGEIDWTRMKTPAVQNSPDVKEMIRRMWEAGIIS